VKRHAGPHANETNAIEEDMPHLVAKRLALLFAVTLTGVALVACGGNDSTDPAGGNTTTGSGAGTTTTTSTGALTIEAYAPADGAVVRMNQKVHVRFSAGAEGDFIAPSSVQLLIDGEPSRIWEYYDEALANRDFRFVPFPVWSPSDTHVATILAGAAYANDPSLELAEDFSWSFTIEDTPLSEQYDSATTPQPSPDELATMAGAGAFAEANLVQDWEDPSSDLYQVSIAVQPDDPDVIAFADRMLASLAPLSGVGLAAPQVGIGRRLFVADVNGEHRAFINPRIESYSAAELYYGFAEGCLSIPGVSSIVGRPASISVEFDTPAGDHLTGYALENFDAKVWLHEYDHLNGILQTDREERRDW
jgi:peptide deformylase